MGTFFVRAATDHLAKSSAGYFSQMRGTSFARNQLARRIAGRGIGPGSAETGY
jgi:hypothetical protein